MSQDQGGERKSQFEEEDYGVGFRHGRVSSRGQAM